MEKKNTFPRFEVVSNASVKIESVKQLLRGEKSLVDILAEVEDEATGWRVSPKCADMILKNSRPPENN